MTHIFHMILRYLPQAVGISLAISALFLFGYFVLYKWLLNGRKRLAPLQTALILLFFLYLAVVACATLLERGEYGHRRTNLRPLTLYRLAWHNANSIEWDNLVLNVLMFVPFGVFLPLISSRFRRFWKTACAGLAGSFLIEAAQYITSRGQASTDDLINNTWGAMIGYGLIMLILMLLGKTGRSPLRAVGYLAPLCAAVLTFGFII